MINLYKLYIHFYHYSIVSMSFLHWKGTFYCCSSIWCILYGLQKTTSYFLHFTLKLMVTIWKDKGHVTHVFCVTCPHNLLVSNWKDLCAGCFKTKLSERCKFRLNLFFNVLKFQLTFIYWYWCIVQSYKYLQSALFCVHVLQANIWLTGWFPATASLVFLPCTNLRGCDGQWQLC